MKKFILLLCILSSVLFTSSAQQGEWTWMTGSSNAFSAGTFGTQGVTDSLNTPPALYGPGPFTDKQGNFWLFAGYHNGTSASALWKFEPATAYWTWMKGPSTVNQFGVYGTQGVSDPNNYPGARGYGFLTWTDTTGHFWVYGGLGNGETLYGSLGDLWKYDPSINEWTWVNGSKTPGISPVYGTKGVPSATNTPGSRSETTASWTDSLNRLWFYGGYDNFSGEHNDLWMYDIATNEWTWMGGSTSTGLNPSYGTQGVFSATNTPGGRLAYSSWTGADGSFWFFGGDFPTEYADLWKYDYSINEWAWISGSSQAGYNGDHGPKCDTSVYFPKGRSENRSRWVDCCGNLWLLGGGDCNGTPSMNDLWIYLVDANKWAFLSGDSTNNPGPSYGTKGVSSPTNKPAGKIGAGSWIDHDGNLWLFGGASQNWATTYNDMWRYVPDTSCYGCKQFCNSLLPPIAGFFSSDSIACEAACIDFTDNSGGVPTSWEWQFPGAVPSSSTDQNPTNICYNASGSYDVTLIIGNANGADTLVLTSFIVIGSAPLPPVITQAGSVLNSSPANSYQWYFSGLSIPGATSQSYTATQSGVYSVQITDSIGCAAISDYLFSLIALSTTDTTLCEKFCIDFFDQSLNNPVSWLWTFDGALPATSSAQNPAGICYDDPGTFDVTLITTDAGGNSDTLMLIDFITVYQNPFAPTITQSGNILTSSSASSYQWQFNGIDIPGATSQSYEITESGLYTVVIEDANGCVAQSVIKAEYVGIEDLSSGSISIYPNPTSGNFIVEWLNAPMNNEISLQIINAIGQKLFLIHEKVSTAHWKKEIDLSDAAKGVYFLEIKTNEDCVRKKIIVSR